MKYLIKIAYDGSKFYGFQRLNELKTVQKTLEEALAIINKKPVVLKGAGRTDRGVHAKGQYCHFELEHQIEPLRLINALNNIVRPAINVLSCQIVNADFHARFRVKQKIYEYKINMGDFDLFQNDYIYQLNRKLNTKKMKQASKALLGIHDYHNFVSGKRNNYLNQIFKIKFSKKKDILTIKFYGKSFYRYMVRNIVGLLIQIGLGNVLIEEVQNRLDNPNQSYTMYTAPSCGLYLVDIIY